jgi:hypothetical protein
MQENKPFKEDNGRPLIDGRSYEPQPKADLTQYTKISKAVPDTKPYHGQQGAPIKPTNINEFHEIKPHNYEYSPKHKEDYQDHSHVQIINTERKEAL